MIRYSKHFVLANSALVVTPLFVVQLLSSTDFACSHSHFVTKMSNVNRPYIWVKKNCPQFREIVLTWNAKKPATGTLIFSISCLVNGEWTGWKRLATWGKGIHLTHSRIKSPRLHTKHVRAEIPCKFSATGFRVCVSCSGGAPIKNLSALFCCTSNENLFRSEIGKTFGLPTVRVEGLQAQSQMELKHKRAPAMCTATSLCIATQRLNGFKANGTSNKRLRIEIPPFADAAYDQSLNIYGSWGLNIAEAYQRLKKGIFLRAERLNSFRDLHALLKKKIPVVVSIRGPIKGGALPYLDGHFIVVAGWSKKHQRVLCIDPAFKPNSRTKTSYALDDFLRSWERSRRFACVAIKKS